MSSITKNSAITFSTQILIFAMGFVASIILARVLGPEGKGIYALIVLVPALMLKLGSLGIEAANVYFTGSKQYGIKDIVSNSLLCGILLSSILIFLFLGVFHLDIFQNYLASNQINPFYLWIVVLTVPLSLLSGFMISVFLGAEKITIYNKINIFNSTFQLILLTVFLVILKKGVFGAVISYVLGIIGLALVVIILIKQFNKITFSFNRRLLKDSTKYGLKAYVGNLAQFLNYRLDMLLVAAFLTPASVGFYSIAVAIAERLWMLPGAIATVLFPRISSLKDKEANNLTPRIARYTFLIIFVLALILALIARPLIKILFGSVFLPSVMPLIILLPGIIALGGCKILTADLAGRGKPQFGTYAAFVSLAVNIPLNLWLIPKWGISGAAFASSVAYITATLIVIVAFVEISNTSWVTILLFNKHDFQDYKNLLAKLRKKGKQMSSRFSFFGRN
jgi:O-antigen/teichoic acid export membrane protein